MFEILGITASFFAIIALGAFTKYIGLFDEKSSQIFSNFAFYVALPPMIITSIIANPIKGLINFDYIVRFEIATLIIFILSYTVAKFIFKLKSNENSVFALNATYSNYGYIGLPLVLLLFGQKAIVPAAIILVFDIAFVLALVAVFSTNFNNTSGFLNFINALKSIIKNPVIISCVIGLLLSVFLIATLASYFAEYIKKHIWLGYLGLFVILIISIQLIIGGLVNYEVLSINEKYKFLFL